MIEMDVEVSNCTCEDQCDMNVSPETTEEDNYSPDVRLNLTESEELCVTILRVPASETELDPVDPEGVPGPNSSEQEPVFPASLEVDISDARNPTEVPEVTKIGKFFSFFQKLFGFKAQPETDPGLLSVSEDSDYESASEMDEVDMEQSYVSEPETELDLVDPEGVPGPSSSEQELLYVDLIKPLPSSNLKRSVLVFKLIKEPAEPSIEEVEGSSGIEQDGMNASPEIPQADRPTEAPETWKISADFPMIDRFLAQHQTDPDVAEMTSVSEESESASEMDEVDMEQSYVSDPETELNLVQFKGPSISEQEPVMCETLYVDLIKPHPSFNLKRSVLISKLVKEPAEPSIEEVEGSSGIEQDGINASPETTQVDRPKDQADAEQTSVPEPEAELDLVDPEGVPGPRRSEQEPVPTESMDVNITDATNPTERTKVRKISKICAFFKKLYDRSAKLKAEPDTPQRLSGPDASTPDLTDPTGPVIDEEAVDYSPETPKDHSPTGITKEWLMTKLHGSSCFPPQKLLDETFPFEKHNCRIAALLKIEASLNKCEQPLSPFTKVWRNVYIGDEETARNRAKLRELGVTHILNAAAPKITWRGEPKEKGLKGKILTGPGYYKGMDIKYCGLPTTYDQFRIAKYFRPAGRFIRRALRNPDNVLFLHCKHGVSHSPTLFVAYLMTCYKIPLEDAVGYVTRARRIRPFTSFLLQLLLLESKIKIVFKRQQMISSEM